MHDLRSKILPKYKRSTMFSTAMTNIWSLVNPYKLKKFWYFFAKVFSFNAYKWKHWSIQFWKILTVGFSEAYNNRYYERHFSTLSTEKEFLWDIYLKWINFRADYISWFSRILAFSEKYISYKISQNFPSVKFNLREI